MFIHLIPAGCGSATFVQRFGSSLNLNPHVHVLMLDGVYVHGDEAPVFVAAPPLSDQDVQQIVQTSAGRIIRLCTRRGLLDDTVADPLADEEPVLAALTAASVRGLIAYRGAHGAPVLRSVLRSSAGVGGPAGADVFRRHQPMRGRWRSPADPRRRDRSGLDPRLSGGRRAAAEGAAVAVRGRRLTCLVDRLLAPGPYGLVAPSSAPLSTGLAPIRATGNPTVLRALPKDLQTILRELTLPLACAQRLDRGPKNASFYLYLIDNGLILLNSAP